MSLAGLAQRIEQIEFVVGLPPGGAGSGGERPLKLFAVFIVEIAGSQTETFWDFDPMPGAKWDDHACYGAEHLDELALAGYDVVLVFDAVRCDHSKLVECTYWSTPEDSEARAAEAQAHADVFPKLKEENLYFWRDCVAGQFLRLIEQQRGAK